LRPPLHLRSFSITAVLLFLLASCTGDRPDSLTVCVQHETLQSHIHVTFVPVLDRNPSQLPADIGITPDCMRPLHTHASDFTIHVESPGNEEWTMGDFFRAWGDDNPYEGLETASVSVNGERYEDDYSGIVLEGKMRVIIDFISQ
jgi:hypothetical protein